MFVQRQLSESKAGPQSTDLAAFQKIRMNDSRIRLIAGRGSGKTVLATRWIKKDSSPPSTRSCKWPIARPIESNSSAKSQCLSLPRQPLFSFTSSLVIAVSLLYPDAGQ
jgi:hypothetical protein